MISSAHICSLRVTLLITERGGEEVFGQADTEKNTDPGRQVGRERDTKSD